MKRRGPILSVLFLVCLGLTPFLPGALAQSLQNEAGFMAIEPITFYFHFGSYFNRLSLKSSRARIWYSFHAADEDRPETPLFVFFNGGPGSATSFGLMSMYTGRYTLDNRVESGGGDAYIVNPVPWTRLGHLLYIDARQTGFSYNLMNQVQDEGSRFQEFNAQNFNSFYDAADFIRVLLRFLAAHPALQRHPVVIVGESYGGVRATAMLHLLLNYADYKNGRETFQDPALADEIQAHYSAVFPQYAGQVVPPGVIAQQFGHQVLIQPALSFNYQEETENEMLARPGSPLYKIGEEVGVSYDPGRYPDPLSFVQDVAGRDLYIYTKPRDWLDGFFNNAGVLLRFVQNLSLVTGVDVTAIGDLYASSRAAAYRVVSTNYPAALEPMAASTAIQALFLRPARLEAPNVQQEPGDMAAVFGSLRPWDRYFIGSNGNANWAFHVYNVALVRGYDIHSWEPRYGRMFLENVAHVKTFVTNAALDLVVYTAALPPSLAKHSEILVSAQHISQGGEARPGKIILNYQPSAFPDIAGLNTRTIRFPLYDKSCHAVSLTQPLDLFTDVSDWLRENGLAFHRRERR
jgi:pimeloyl-ACP methyl ester carboxylesterase